MRIRRKLHSKLLGAFHQMKSEDSIYNLPIDDARESEASSNLGEAVRCSVKLKTVSFSATSD